MDKIFLLLFIPLMFVSCFCSKDKKQELNDNPRMENEKTEIGFEYKKNPSRILAGGLSAGKEKISIPAGMNSEGVVVVSTSDNYKSWKECLDKNKNKDIFLVKPGDYRTWGKLDFKSVSGTAGKIKKILYWDGTPEPFENDDWHPVRFSRNRSKEVLIEGFNFNDASYWYLFGLTVRGNSLESPTGEKGGGTNFFDNNSNHNVLNKCVVEKIHYGNGIRIRSCSYNTISNCVIREKLHYMPSSDNVAITISAYRNKEATGNKIIDNEIYNFTDGIQLNYKYKAGGTKKPHYDKVGDIKGTVIFNNDIYITDDLYFKEGGNVLACAENGIDVKGGNSTGLKKDRNIISNNRIWGYRESKLNCGASGSVGDAILIHFGAANLAVEDNIIFDSVRGVKVKPFNSHRSGRKIEHINIENNLIYNIRKYSERGNGVALMSGSDITIKNNTVIDADIGLEIVANPKIDFQKNHLKNVTLFRSTPKGTLVGKDNNLINQRKSSAGKEIHFYIKQWTGKEKVTIKI